MGAFYDSILIPGDQRSRVRDSLSRWLHAKGFELSTQPMLFDLDGEAERSAFVLSNERWTIVVYSKHEEEQRLIHELQSLDEPLLYVWVHDSDVWGYDLFSSAGIAASFSSDADGYRPFAGEVERPPTDPGEMCRLLEMPGQAPELERIQRQRSIFKEDVCLEFCRLLGAEAALLGYDDLERGAAENFADWNCEQLLFFRRDVLSAPSCGIDLHDIRLRDLASELSYVERSKVELSPEILAEVERMRQQARFRLLLLRPISWLAQSWRWGREQMAQPRRPPPELVAKPRPLVPAEASTEGGVRVTNKRHGCTVILALAAEPKKVSGKPASVFAFHVGEVTVTCTARRLWKIAEVLRPPERSRVVRDECFHVAGLPARHLFFQLPPRYMAESADPTFLSLHVIQTPQALYVFLGRFAGARDPIAEQAIRATVESFRLTPGPPPQTAK